MPTAARKLALALSSPRAAAIALVALTLLAFGKALSNAYAYDGISLIARMRPFAHDPWVVFDAERYGAATAIMSWRPLGALLTMLVDIRLFGERPVLSHALNLVLHAATAVGIYRIGLRLVGAQAGAAERLACLAGAALFAVHPLVSEVVLCAGFRYDSIATLSIVAAVLCLLRANERPALAIAAALASMAVGLLAKESAAACLPVGVAAMLAMRARRGPAAAFAVGALVVLAAWFAAWSRFRYEGYSTEYLGGGGRVLGVANFCVASVEIYLRKLLLPWPLRIDYRFEPATSLLSGRVIFAASVLVLLGAAVVRLACKHPLCLVGAAWIVAGFAPVSQIVPVPDPVAERFCHAPMAGAALLLAGGLTLLAKRRALFERAGWVAAALIVAWTGLSVARSLEWRDEISLNLTTWRGLDTDEALESRGALHLLRASRAADPAAARSSLALAEAELSRLLARTPDHPAGNRLMGAACLATGRLDEAERFAAAAVRLAPDDPAAKALRAACEKARTSQPPGNPAESLQPPTSDLRPPSR